MHAGPHAGLDGGAQRVAELQVLDHRRIAVEQRLAAALKAVEFDGREAEHPFEGAGQVGAEVRRRDDAALGVHVLQAGLHRLGYEPLPDGKYTDETRITVEAFQRHWRPSKVDGIADGETRATLMGVLQLATAESVTGVLN